MVSHRKKTTPKRGAAPTIRVKPARKPVFSASAKHALKLISTIEPKRVQSRRDVKPALRRLADVTKQIKRLRLHAREKGLIAYLLSSQKLRIEILGQQFVHPEFHQRVFKR